MRKKVNFKKVLAALIAVAVGISIFFSGDYFVVNRRLGEDKISSLRADNYILNAGSPSASYGYVSLDKLIERKDGMTIILCEVIEEPSQEDLTIELDPGSPESAIFEKMTGNGKTFGVRYGCVWVDVIEVISAEKQIQKAIDGKQIPITWSFVLPYPEYVPGNRMIMAIEYDESDGHFGAVVDYYVTDDNFVIPAWKSPGNFPEDYEKYNYEGCTVEYFRRTAGKMNDEAIAKYEKELAAKE